MHPLCPDNQAGATPWTTGTRRGTAEAYVPATAPADETPASHRSPRTVRARVPGNWPLLAILAVQTILSLRLIGADTAFQDEALYLWAGHLEWARVLHGTPIPQFPSYFSGAPVIDELHVLMGAGGGEGSVAASTC